MTLRKQLQIVLAQMLVGIDGDCTPGVGLDHNMKIVLTWTFTTANGNPGKVVRNFPVEDADVGIFIKTGVEQVQKLMGDA